MSLLHESLPPDSNWIHRLAAQPPAQEVGTPEHWSAYEEPRLIQYLLLFPEQADTLASHLRAENFRNDRCQYILATALNLLNGEGTFPTRERLRDQIGKQLMVDDPHEEVFTILDGKLDPREVASIRNALQHKLTQLIYSSLYSEEAIAAIFRRDYSHVERAQEQLQAIKGGTTRFSNVLTYEQILTLDIPPIKWLVQDVLEADGFAVIGGPLKSMKSSVMLDLALSLVTGQKFLDQFTVPEPKRVLVISGETSDAEMKTRLTRINKGPKAEGGELWWHQDAAQLTNPEYLLDLEAFLRVKRPDVVVIDPMYVSLANAEHTNVMSMGPVLAKYAGLCRKHGATPVVVHHFNRKGERHAKPTLQDLTMAGIAEFARQWILLRHREEYQHDGVHHLWAVTGSSSGRSACYQMRIAEERWQIALTLAVEEEKAAKKQESVVRDQQLQEVVNAVRTVTATTPATQKQLQTFLEVSGRDVKRLLTDAVEQGLLAVVSKEVKGRMRQVYETRDNDQGTRQ